MRSTALTRARSWTVGILSASAVATGVVGVHLAQDHVSTAASKGTSTGNSSTSTTPQQQSNSGVNCAVQLPQRANSSRIGGSQPSREDGEHDDAGNDDGARSHEAELSALVPQSPHLAQSGQAAQPCQPAQNNQGSQSGQSQNGFGSSGQLGSGSGAPQVMSRGS